MFAPKYESFSTSCMLCYCVCVLQVKVVKRQNMKSGTEELISNSILKELGQTGEKECGDIAEGIRDRVEAKDGGEWSCFVSVGDSGSVIRRSLHDQYLICDAGATRIILLSSK